MENQNEILAKLDLLARKDIEAMDCESHSLFENLPLRTMPQAAEFEEELSNGNTKNLFVSANLIFYSYCSNLFSFVINLGCSGILVWIHKINRVEIR